MKLYVIIRKDLSTSQQAVQAGHAVAEFLLHGHCSSWNNGTLVYLGVENENHLHLLRQKLDFEGIKYSEFIEPDIGNQITAIATNEESKYFKKLNLL
jgi:hypothetical protein